MSDDKLTITSWGQLVQITTQSCATHPPPTSPTHVLKLQLTTVNISTIDPRFMLEKNINISASKPCITFFSETDIIVALVDITTPHSVSKPYTNQRIGHQLKTHFVKIKHIKMRRIINPFFVSPEHSTKYKVTRF